MNHVTLRPLPTMVGKFEGIDLIDILRALCRCRMDSVIGRSWRLSEVDIEMMGDLDFGYGGDELSLLFPEAEIVNEAITVPGRRLMEGVACAKQTESALVQRIANSDGEVIPEYVSRLYRGPTQYYASNVDLELRASEYQWELLVDDERLVDSLSAFFKIDHAPQAREGRVD